MAKYRMRDLVVVLPGITGSVLSTISDAGERRDVWNLSGQAVWSFLTAKRETLHRLTVPQHDPRRPPPDTDITAVGLVNGFHGVFGLAKIDGYQILYDELRERFDVRTGQWTDSQPANLVAFPYDWRLSNRASAQAFEAGIRDKLAAWRDFSDEPEAQLILVAHSMGGLVARYWLEVLEGWRDTRALITFGTPYRGSVDALGYVANGYKKAFGDLTKVLLSCPSVYELLPVYRSIRSGDQWCRPHEVELPVFDPALAELANVYSRAAAEFHDEIKAKVAEHGDLAAYRSSYARVPFIGVHQRTMQSAVLEQGVLTLNDELPHWIEDDVEGGDGTVPRVSAIPIEMDNPFGSTFVAGRHSGLQNVPSALDDLVERVHQSQSRSMDRIQGSYAAKPSMIDLVIDDVFLAEEPVNVRARVLGRDGRQVHGAMRAVVEATDGRRPPSAVDLLDRDDDYATAVLPPLPPGQYRVVVEVADPLEVDALPVTDVIEVAAQESA